jgi:hypothetical protein
VKPGVCDVHVERREERVPQAGFWARIAAGWVVAGGGVGRGGMSKSVVVVARVVGGERRKIVRRKLRACMTIELYLYKRSLLLYLRIYCCIAGNWYSCLL